MCTSSVPTECILDHPPVHPLRRTMATCFNMPGISHVCARAVQNVRQTTFFYDVSRIFREPILTQRERERERERDETAAIRWEKYAATLDFKQPESGKQRVSYLQTVYTRVYTSLCRESCNLGRSHHSLSKRGTFLNIVRGTGSIRMFPCVRHRCKSKGRGKKKTRRWERYAGRGRVMHIDDGSYEFFIVFYNLKSCSAVVLWFYKPSDPGGEDGGGSASRSLRLRTGPIRRSGLTNCSRSVVRLVSNGSGPDRGPRFREYALPLLSSAISHRHRPPSYVDGEGKRPCAA